MLVGAFNQEKVLVAAFSVIVQLHRLIVYSTTTLCRETEAEEWRVVVQETLEDERDPGHETLHRPGTLHTFFFPPTRARYVKLAVLQSHDPYQVANLQYFYAGYMEGREITVLISKQSPHPACRRPDDYRG